MCRRHELPGLSHGWMERLIVLSPEPFVNEEEVTELIDNINEARSSRSSHLPQLDLPTTSVVRDELGRISGLSESGITDALVEGEGGCGCACMPLPYHKDLRGRDWGEYHKVLSVWRGRAAVRGTTSIEWEKLFIAIFVPSAWRLLRKKALTLRDGHIVGHFLDDGDAYAGEYLFQ